MAETGTTPGADNGRQFQPENAPDASQVAGAPQAAPVSEQGVPVQPAPEQGIPEQQVPAQEAPAQQVSAEGVPAQQVPAQEASAQGSPVQGEPLQGDIPVATPIYDAPAQADPAAAAAAGQVPPEQPAPGADAAGQAAAATGISVAPAAAPSTVHDESTMDALQTLERRRKERRRKRIIRGSIAAAIAALVFVGPVVAGALFSSNEPTTSYIYEPVVLDTYTQSVTAQGSTRPASTSVVTPEVDGIIEEVYVIEGQVVSQGDTLLHLSSSSVDKVVADAERELRNAEQAVNTAYDAANRAYQADAQAAAEGEHSETAPAAQAELDSSYNNFLDAQAKLQEAQDQAAKKDVAAPSSGTITIMNAVKGMQVGGGLEGAASGAGASNSPLIQISDLTTMRVEVQVNESDISSITAGQEATISFTALPEVILTGQVEHIATVATGTEGGGTGGGGGATTYAVEVLIPEPDERIKPGMTANVEIVAESRPDSLMVPTNAVSYDENGDAFVTVALDEEGTQTEKRIIEVVASGDGMEVITGDISEGELVAVPLGSASAGMDAESETAGV